MGPGTADFGRLCEGSAWRLPAVEPRFSLLHTMCVGRNTLIGQNMWKIVENLQGDEAFHSSLKKMCCQPLKAYTSLPVTTDI
jgi:hypothetical protein